VPASPAHPRAASPSPRLTDIAIDAPGGFRLVPGSVGVARMAELGPSERATLLAGLTDLEQDSDILLIDTAAGVGMGVLSLLNTADVGVVIATPEPTSIADAYALIKCVLLQDASARRADRLARGMPAAAPAPSLTLVVNQARGPREAAAIHGRLALVCRRFLRFELPMLGWIAQDAHVAMAVRNKRPFLLEFPRSRAGRSVVTLAANLARALPAHALRPAQPANSGSLAARFSRLFHRSPTP
jgi:flagellar biosynthesis protein FlhG